MVSWGSWTFLLLWLTHLTLAVRLWNIHTVFIHFIPLFSISLHKNTRRCNKELGMQVSNETKASLCGCAVCLLFNTNKWQTDVTSLVYNWKLYPQTSKALSYQEIIFWSKHCHCNCTLLLQSHNVTTDRQIFFPTWCWWSSFGVVLWRAVTWAAAMTPPPGPLRNRHFGWGRFGHWRWLHFFLSFDCGPLLTENRGFQFLYQTSNIEMYSHINLYVYVQVHDWLLHCPDECHDLKLVKKPNKVVLFTTSVDRVLFFLCFFSSDDFKTLVTCLLGSRNKKAHS